MYVIYGNENDNGSDNDSDNDTDMRNVMQFNVM